MDHSNFLYVMKQLELGFRPLFFAICDEAGLTGAQYTALTVLERHPGITSSELARRSFVRAQTMAATLDPLIENGYVRREKQPQSGRRITLFITEAGARLTREITPRIDALEDHLLRDLSASERATLSDYLRRCRNSLDSAREELLPELDSNQQPAG